MRSVSEILILWADRTRKTTDILEKRQGKIELIWLYLTHLTYSIRIKPSRCLWKCMLEAPQGWNIPFKDESTWIKIDLTQNRVTEFDRASQKQVSGRECEDLLSQHSETTCLWEDYIQTKDNDAMMLPTRLVIHQHKCLGKMSIYRWVLTCLTQTVPNNHEMISSSCKSLLHHCNDITGFNSQKGQHYTR